MEHEKNKTQSELYAIIGELSRLIEQANNTAGLNIEESGKLLTSLAGIRARMQEEFLRVAVVGPIKSGKSTFVNSFLGKDYLKRGAGVITSIVTRVQKGQSLLAELDFKSFDEINTDISRALTYFPLSDMENREYEFDIRRSHNRKLLQEAVYNAGSEMMREDEIASRNLHILHAYLTGYERIKDIASADNITRKFEAKDFEAHQEFAGNDSLSVYLKDIRLWIPSDTLDENLELADCQGSDSPNPLHLMMIQDYLAKSHFLIYVISLRTGVRQADIRFLSMIRKMGILDNIIFVLNIDFSEHENADDLERLIQKTKQELFLIKPDPEVYGLSALYNLFARGMDLVSDKNRLRMEQWEKDEKMLEISSSGTKGFQKAFIQKFTTKKALFFHLNHIKRLKVMLEGVIEDFSMTKEILMGSARDAAKLLEDIREQNQKAEEIKAMMKSTFQGEKERLFLEIKINTDRFLDPKSGNLVKGLSDYIWSYRLPAEKFAGRVTENQFGNCIYQVFQEFQQSVDNHLAETIIPEIHSFVKSQEKIIQERLHSVALPYNKMILDIKNHYAPNADTASQKEEKRFPEIETVKQSMDIQPPSFGITARYSPRVRTRAHLKLGLYAGLRVVRRFFKKPFLTPEENRIQALADALSQMKWETIKSLHFDFLNFRENLKFQYFLKLQENLSNLLLHRLEERFSNHNKHMENLAQMMGAEKGDKQAMTTELKRMTTEAQTLLSRIEASMKDMESALPEENV